MITFVFFIFLAFWPFPWQRKPLWKNQPLKSTTSHGIWDSYKVLLSLIKASPRNRVDKNVHTLPWIFLRCFMKFDERKKFFLNPPFFNFHGNCDKVWPTDSDLYGLSRSTRCGCDRKHYCKNWWSLETFVAPWLPWQRPPFWKCFNHQKLPHTTVDIPTKFDEVWWKESKTN